MTLAKGLGSGLPIGPVVAKEHHGAVEARRARQHLWWQSARCAAAMATLDLVEREYAANAAKSAPIS